LAVTEIWSRYWFARCLIETGLLACLFYALSGPAFEAWRPGFADAPLRAYREAVHQAADEAQYVLESGPARVVTLRIERMRREYIDNNLKLNLPR
jgi:hypothetical protein